MLMLLLSYLVSKVEKLIKTTQDPPVVTLGIKDGCFSSENPSNLDTASRLSVSESQSETDSRHSPVSNSSQTKKVTQSQILAQSIKEIKDSLAQKDPIEEFERLSRKKLDESLEESQLSENIDKNRYRDILPYDSTRVQLMDSMTGDYINANFVDMTVPSGMLNRYIATQGPLESTCDDFWQMVWERNCSLIIMVTTLVENGRVKCHQYWPKEKD